MILAFLLGCPKPGLCIQPVAATTTDLRITLTQGRACDAPVEQVREVVFRRGPQRLWSVSTSPPRALHVLSYGVVPDGFESTETPAPLQPGDALTIEVNGPDSGSTSISLEAATPAP